MNRIKLLTGALMAMLAVGALSASSAFAGPLFLLGLCAPRDSIFLELGYLTHSECLAGTGLESIEPGVTFYSHELKLLEGELTNVTTTNLGDFTLHSTATGAPEVLCTGLGGPTTLLGGDPGKSDTEIQFSGCTATGAITGGGTGTCDALSKGGTPGNITVPADDELVYIGVKAEAEKEEGPLGDLFTPAGGGTSFVTLIFLALTGQTCPSTAAGEVKVNGSVIGEVEPVESMSKEGMLHFPKSAVKTGFQWLSPGHVLEVKAALNSFGGTSTELGLADLKLESGEEWGVLRK